MTQKQLLELKKIDKEIIKELKKGTRNPSWLADKLDYSRQYIHTRLQVLVAAEKIENIGHGLYQIKEG